ncbi:hypothetical protein GCM10025858_28690 [Alicyclobacillus sacchari]|nr:hypothetical protein GCM10025858_28690 [Alicyclobacillus sacchari]
MILGFTSVYREGFEVVLFLQNTRMQVGSQVVVIGATIGLVLTMMVAVLTFFAHRKLPYKRMLVLTGVMLGAVLLVMVGEQVQEMQQAIGCHRRHSTCICLRGRGYGSPCSIICRVSPRS